MREILHLVRAEESRLPLMTERLLLKRFRQMLQKREVKHLDALGMVEDG